jgi:3-phosphoglycerate kinase
MSVFEKLQVRGKRVLLRLDLNVPLNRRKVADATRIEAALPTITSLRERGAKVIICSHLGRPKGQSVPALSLEPVAAWLAECLDTEVVFAHETVGENVEHLSKDLQPSGILMVENLRFHKGEKGGDPDFAKQLARLGDVYVNDAFGVLHREHASVVGVGQHMEEKALGPLIQREVHALDRLVKGAVKPFVGILGGAKVSDKIGVMEALMERCDAVLIGGAMAYTFMLALGQPTGKSLVEPDRIRLAKRLLDDAASRGIKVLLPVDHIAVGPDQGPATVVEDLGTEFVGYDIGPKTASAYAEIISRANSIFWNGPMGMFEKDDYAGGTKAVAEALAASRAYSVVGGGDSAAAINKMGLADKVSHISTGGGASLQYMEGNGLPGLQALKAKRSQ